MEQITRLALIKIIRNAKTLKTIGLYDSMKIAEQLLQVCTVRIKEDKK